MKKGGFEEPPFFVDAPHLRAWFLFRNADALRN